MKKSQLQIITIALLLAFSVGAYIFIQNYSVSMQQGVLNDFERDQNDYKVKINGLDNDTLHLVNTFPEDLDLIRVRLGGTQCAVSETLLPKDSKISLNLNSCSFDRRFNQTVVSVITNVGVFSRTIYFNQEFSPPPTGYASFISVWNTSKSGKNNQWTVELPLKSYGNYNFLVDWGDGNEDIIKFWNQEEKIHVYSSPGVYTVTLNGIVEGFAFDEGAPVADDLDDCDKLIDIQQWGDLILSNYGDQFSNCENLDISALDTPNLTVITNLSRMFSGSNINITNINSWDVSSVTNMYGMFAGSVNFNQDIGSWDTSNVVDMGGMFSYAYDFNQSIGSWDTSNVVDMGGMFRNAILFNQYIGGWDTSNVVDMGGMFRNAILFNQDISSWNTSKVYRFNRMFWNANTFNQPLNSWDTSNVINMYAMFYGADVFNQDLDNWDTHKVTNMESMFRFANDFNGDVTTWDTGNVTDMKYMFDGNYDFNQDISGWNTSKVQRMGQMFYDAKSFNQPIGSWDVGNVYDFRQMFQFNDFFNQSLNSWDTSSATDMGYMFFNANVFNQDLDNWDTHKVTNMENMFEGADLFNGNISTWDVGKVTDMSYMFFNATSFNQDLNNWDTSKVTTMNSMFEGADLFNGNVSTWNVGNVTIFIDMFKRADSFNQDLDGWDMSSAEDIEWMFMDNDAFNGKVGNWDTSNVNDMSGVFWGAVNFNQNITGWDTSNVDDMYGMFTGASLFNQNIDMWNVSNVTNMGYMFYGTSSFEGNLRFWCVDNIASEPIGFDNSSLLATNNRGPQWGTCPITPAFTFHNATGISGTSYFTIPSHAREGDFAILIDAVARALGYPSARYPTGWVTLDEGTGYYQFTYGVRRIVSYKLLNSSDPGATYRGMDPNIQDGKLLVILRPSHTVDSFNIPFDGYEMDSANPSPIVVPAYGATDKYFVLGGVYGPYLSMDFDRIWYDHYYNSIAADPGSSSFLTGYRYFYNVSESGESVTVDVDYNPSGFGLIVQGAIVLNATFIE